MVGEGPTEEGADRKQAKGSIRQNHTVPLRFSGLSGRRSRAGVGVRGL